MISDDDMALALDRIGRSADGHLLYRFLQKKLMGVLGGPAEAGALNFDNGRRSLAAELMGLMAKGIDDSGSTNNVSGSSVSERAVIFTRAEPRAVSRSRGAGRRINADTRVPGYDPEPGAGR